VQATRILPSNYHHSKTLDLSKPGTVIWLNLAAIPLLILFGWFFSRLIILLRSINPFPGGVWGSITTFSVWGVIPLIISILFMLIFHELIHGLFFWVFTHERPKFALKSGYAFAAAPEWYLPKYQYMLVGLSPLVLISILCILIAVFMPVQIVPYVLLIATFNAAGALGDMIVVAWVCSLPNAILMKDQGDNFSSFAPENE
jgi:Putative zincin peptidase